MTRSTGEASRSCAVLTMLWFLCVEQNYGLPSSGDVSRFARMSDAVTDREQALAPHYSQVAQTRTPTMEVAHINNAVLEKLVMSAGRKGEDVG